MTHTGKFGFGDVVDMPQPTVGAGPPGNRAIIIGFLMTHPETNEVWSAWPEETEEFKLATDVGDLGPEVVKTVLEDARAKYYRCMSNAKDMAADIIKMVLGGSK